MKRAETTRRRVVYWKRKWPKLEKRRIETKRKQKVKRRNEYREKQRLKKEASLVQDKKISSEIRIKIEQRLDPMQKGEETIKAYKTILYWVSRENRQIFVDLSSVEVFTLAGAICLSASIDGMGGEQGRSRSSEVRGNLPRDRIVASDFLASGFFDGFKEEGAEFPSAQASWTNEKQREVVAEKAEKLVDFANSKIRISDGQKDAIWQNLVECMTNTHNHARGNKVTNGGKRGMGSVTWMAGVMCKGNKAHFAFVDHGVGICGSAEAQGFLKEMGIPLTRYGPEKIVQNAFQGELGSWTGSRGRGLGLPRMRRDAQGGLLENLCIRTGKVEGEIDAMNFRRMANNMPGTVLTWDASGPRRQAQ